MRLCESVLATRTPLQRPPRTFRRHRRRRLRLPGPVTCRHRSRDSPDHARPFARHVARAVDLVALNKAARRRVVPPAPAPALVLAARFVPNSGRPTSGRARFWNGPQSRTAQGRDLAALGWLAVTDTGAARRRVAQPPPTDLAADPATTRLAISLAQVPRVVQPSACSPRRSVVTEGDDRTQPVRAGGRARALQPRGNLRCAATRRDRAAGPPRSGPGRPKPDDGKGQWSARSRVARVASGAEGMVRSPPVVNQVPCQRHVRVVMVGETGPNRSARLLRPGIDRAAARREGDDNARGPIACLFRAATPGTGLRDGQARPQAKRAVQFKMSVRAVTWAHRAARQAAHDPLPSGAMASLKRRDLHQPLHERMLTPFAEGTTLDTSRPAEESRCHDGTIPGLVA